MGYEFNSAQKDIQSFQELFLKPAVAHAAKMATEYMEKVKAVDLPEHDAHGLLAAIGERECLTRLSKRWEGQRETLQSLLNDYREHFDDYLKE